MCHCLLHILQPFAYAGFFVCDSWLAAASDGRWTDIKDFVCANNCLSAMLFHYRCTTTHTNLLQIRQSHALSRSCRQTGTSSVRVSRVAKKAVGKAACDLGVLHDQLAIMPVSVGFNI
jgi:hypothetical protein